MPLFIGLLTERLLEEKEFGPEDLRNFEDENVGRGLDPERLLAA